jgi:ABC-type multidrug transport system ATPase subunit
MNIKVDRVTKQYKNKLAVDRVSFELREGVTGLLGANGAGKTTLMRMMSGILESTGGEINAEGIQVTSEQYRAMLGYLPQDFGYYPEFTARKFMMYMSALKGLSKSRAKRKTEELLELVGLADVADKKIGTFSGGMKQRVGIAQTLINDPKILILDEPTAGLDPGERARFRSMIADIGKDNIVLFSTHIVSDLEHIATNVLIMKEGSLVYDGSWDNHNGNLEQFYIKEMETV